MCAILPRTSGLISSARLTLWLTITRGNRSVTDYQGTAFSCPRSVTDYQGTAFSCPRSVTDYQGTAFSCPRSVTDYQSTAFSCPRSVTDYQSTAFSCPRSVTDYQSTASSVLVLDQSQTITARHFLGFELKYHCDFVCSLQVILHCTLRRRKAMPACSNHSFLLEEV